MNPKLRKALEESRTLKRPMKADLNDAGETRWLKKPVLETRKLPMATEWAAMKFTGPGRMEVCGDRTVSGCGSVRVTMPTSTGAKSPVNRCYDTSEVWRALPHEDLTRYNRISLWVYADAPGWNSIFLSVSLHNEGEHIMPQPGRFEGTHFPAVQEGRWQQLIWEIPHIYRDNVTALSFGVMLLGSQPEFAEEISICYDDLRLEVVEAENDLGFDLRRDAIAYCHSGYRPGATKQALVQHCDVGQFTVLNETGAEAFRGAVQQIENGFALLDFSDLDKPGEYTIRVGTLQSKPFSIGPEAYLSAAWKTLATPPRRLFSRLFATCAGFAATRRFRRGCTGSP